jgi:ABC-type uncharacterized transport system substrate-binding protein
MQFDRLKRREFITLLGGVALCPAAARAEKGNGIRRVGVIMGFAENDEVWQAYLASFRQGLQELGWTDGRNIRFDHRFTGESEERMLAMAEEVVALQPDVILVSTNSVVSATLKATRSIPITAISICGPGSTTNRPSSLSRAPFMTSSPRTISRRKPYGKPLSVGSLRITLGAIWVSVNGQVCSG